MRVIMNELPHNNIYVGSVVNKVLSNTQDRPFKIHGTQFKSVVQFYTYMKFVDPNNWVGLSESELEHNLKEVLKTNDLEKLKQLYSHKTKYAKFIEERWIQTSDVYVFVAIYYSFEQNKTHLDELIKTQGMAMVYETDRTHWVQLMPQLIQKVRDLFVMYPEKIDRTREFKRIVKKW